MTAVEEHSWKFAQCFGDKSDSEDITEADIISAVDFDQTGDFLATGDKGGRIVIFERNTNKSGCEYKFYTEFQSHEPEFDCLKSMEIEEKINKIKWCRRQNPAHFLLSTNDKTIKLWKVFEKNLKVVAEGDLDHDVAMTGSQSLRLPKMARHDTIVAAVPRKTYSNAHTYHINSISINSDDETYLSADDLRINLWNFGISEQSFNIVDIKPTNMEELTEVITAAEFHPQHCNLFMYSSSKGSIKLADMRAASLCDQHAKLYEDIEDPSQKSFFSEIIASISDVKFSNDGRYILARDYLTLKIWDINMDNKPVTTINIHEKLRNRLCDLYENDSIFDKFECTFSGDGRSVMTGSYDNDFHIWDIEGKTDITLQADKSAFRGRRSGSSKSRLSRKPPRNDFGNDYIDFNKKILHASWHPRENTIAVAATNNLFIFAMATLDTSNQQALLKTVILGLIAGAAFSSRLFSIVRYESVIHEFDPWFNYRTTQMLVKDGFYEFWNWFDPRAWYPLGRVVGGTVYPGLMVTSAIIHNLLHFLNFPVDIRNVCVLLAPVFSAATAYATYLLTCEIKDSSAGLLAAAFIGIAPGYISRSVAGSYDNEGIAIFLLMFTFYLWIKALKLGSALWAAAAAFFYFYMVAAWGGYVFIINLIPLHVLVLMIMGRFSTRVYVSYSTFYILGTLMSMQIPFVGFQPTRTSEHMAALGVFGLCQILAFVELVRSHVQEKQFQTLLRIFVVFTFVAGLAALTVLTMSGFIAPWTGRFYSLWDTGYAKIHIPIIASVSEHQPTAWPSFFFDLEMLIFLFPAGVYLCFRQLRDEHVFIIVYSVFASYFAGVMVRLMLTLTPVVCISAAVALSTILDTYLDFNTVESNKPSTTSTPSTSTESRSKHSSSSKESEQPAPKDSYFGILNFDSRTIVLTNFAIFLIIFVWHCTWVTSNAYSSPSIVLASRNPDGSQHIIDDFRESYNWLRQNTKEDAKIMSWWDYGYQISGMADRPTLVDNNTWNNTHIATVGRAMSSGEEDSYEIMKQHDVDYVLVIFGGLLGYSGDDINKYLWMIRIAEGVWPDKIKEADYFTPTGDYRVDDQASPAMKNSLMYKMSYYRFTELFGPHAPVDRVRQQTLPKESPELNVLEEAFTSENWIVRIYKVKDFDNLGRLHKDVAQFEAGKKKRKAQRSSKSKARRKQREDSD
ncbi:unnamed protein product [Umbelopsis vinacea]